MYITLLHIFFFIFTVIIIIKIQPKNHRGLINNTFHRLEHRKKQNKPAIAKMIIKVFQNSFKNFISPTFKHTLTTTDPLWFISL